MNKFAVVAIALCVSCVMAEPSVKTRLGALNPRESLVVIDIDWDEVRGYSETVKTNLLDKISHFPKLDGKINGQEFQPFNGMGGFWFQGYNEDDSVVGLGFGSVDYGPGWGFWLWDGAWFSGSAKNKPYFAIGIEGIRMPYRGFGYPPADISWTDIWRGLTVEDVINESTSELQRLNSVNSVAVRNYVARQFKINLDNLAKTGTVANATNVIGVGREKLLYDAAMLGATSTVYSAAVTNYTAWTDPFVAETDGCALHELSWANGEWSLIVIMVEPGFEGDIFHAGTLAGPEDALSLTFTIFGGHVYTFTRSITSINADPLGNRFGYITDETVTNVVEGIVTNLLANPVDEAKVTNVVRKVVHATGRYVWDKDLSVCYRFNAQNGFLDLVAVTNVDVTLPENWAALEAIENEWSAK